MTYVVTLTSLLKLLNPSHCMESCAWFQWRSNCVVAPWNTLLAFQCMGPSASFKVRLPFNQSGPYRHKQLNCNLAKPVRCQFWLMHMSIRWAIRASQIIGTTNWDTVMLKYPFNYIPTLTMHHTLGLPFAEPNVAIESCCSPSGSIFSTLLARIIM